MILEHKNHNQLVEYTAYTVPYNGQHVSKWGAYSFFFDIL